MADKNHSIKYFGFAVTDCEENLLSEVDSFVNLVDMCIFDFSNIHNRIVANTEGNNQVILNIAGIFIESIPDPASSTGVKYYLNENYAELFKIWVSANLDLPLEKIAAFYIADEPAWNDMAMADLATVAAHVKDAYPTIPIMVIEAYTAIQSLEITDDIDWIGFDKYGVLQPNTDTEYLQHISELKALRTNPSQNLVIIMESQWIELYEDAGYEQSVLIPMAQSYFQLSKREADVVALISYLLPGHFDSDDQKGFLELEPEVREAIRNIGTEIIK